MTKIILIALIVSLPSFAQDSTPVLTTEELKDDRIINHKKSHWVTSFGFEGMKYELPWNFEGQRKNIRKREQELYGGRLGLGGQLYLGRGFYTTTMAEAFYVGTLTRQAKVADPQVPGEEAGSVKRTGGIYGIEVAQQLGYMFEFKAKNPFLGDYSRLTFEPFVEAGLGVAQGHHRVNYEYDTGPSGVQEEYRSSISDQIANARIGGGFNITSIDGFFFQARVIINRYDILKRKMGSYTQQNGAPGASTPTVTDKNAKIDPITVFTVGGGYKF